MRIEGVGYVVNWKRMHKGHSLFVPCIDVPSAKHTLETVAKRLNVALIFKVIVHNGVKGLRVWRV